MVRVEMDPREGKQVAYGLDRGTGIFLSIENLRSEKEEDFTHFQTNSLGLGECLPVWEMAEKMGENGVPPEHIRELFGERIADGVLLKNPGNNANQKGGKDGKSEKNEGKSDENEKIKEELEHVSGRVCANCGGAQAKKRCARCKTVFYCGKECQVEDWNKGGHRHFCGIPVPTKSAFEDPNHKSVVGLLLPETGDAKPRLVEVRCTRGGSNEEGGDFWVPDLAEFLGAGNAIRPGFNENGMDAGTRDYLHGVILTTPPAKMHGHFHMFQNPEKGGAQRELPDTLMVFFRTWFRADGSPPNRCVERITGMDWDKQPNGWKGPLLVLKVPGRELHSTNSPLKDMELADRADVAAFFRTFPREDILAPIF